MHQHARAGGSTLHTRSTMMSRTAAAALVAMLLLPATTSAQVAASAPCPYESCAVRTTTGFFGEQLVRGAASEKILKIDFMGGNAAEFLSRVESAAAPARRFRSRRSRSAILGLASAAAAIYATVLTVDHLDSGGYATSTDYAVLYTSLAVGIWSGIEGVRSRNALSQAIWQFNRAPVR